MYSFFLSDRANHKPRKCPYPLGTSSTSTHKHLNLKQVAAYNFHVVNGWLNLFRGLYPAPIQIESSQIAPRIAVNNAINIQHGDDLKDEIIS